MPFSFTQVNKSISCTVIYRDHKQTFALRQLALYETNPMYNFGVSKNMLDVSAFIWGEENFPVRKWICDVPGSFAPREYFQTR